jgi:hypothetical protein
MKSFGDVYKREGSFEPAYDCEKAEFADVLDQKIVITEIKMLESKKFGEFPAVKFYFEVDAKKSYFFTSFSGVLKKQMEGIKEELPVRTTIIKKDNYYTCI